MMRDPSPDLNLDKELEIIGAHTHCYLSGWMDETEIQKTLLLLLNADLLPTWAKLKKAANDQDAFENFFLAATDSVHRYKCISKRPLSQRKKDLDAVIKAAEQLRFAVEKLELDSMGITFSLNNYALEQAKLTCDISLRKDITPLPSMENKPERIFLEIKPMMECIQADAQKLRQNPDKRLTNKTGYNGLVAFYTNSLCGITIHTFNRRCYSEIATIANAVLRTDADHPITEENVRVNFLNCTKRMETNTTL